MSDSVRPHGWQPTRLPRPWDSPGKNTGVGCHFLLQEIFPIQRSNSGLLHCRQSLYPLSHQGSPELVVLLTFKSSHQLFSTTCAHSGSCLFHKYIMHSLSLFFFSDRENKVSTWYSGQALKVEGWMAILHMVSINA